MNLDILMIGKFSQKTYEALCQEYLKRCSKRLQARITGCRNYDEMLRRSDGAVVIALDERGKEFDSMGFSKWMGGFVNAGVSRLVFCLGGAEGLNDDVRKKSDHTIRLSSLTLNHQLAMLVLSEQIYRALSILFGEPYHKP